MKFILRAKYIRIANVPLIADTFDEAAEVARAWQESLANDKDDIGESEVLVEYTLGE